MVKFRLYFNKDEETQWLNEMSDKGYAMTGFGFGFYNFEECEKGKWRYQVDFGDRLFSVSNEYREFMKSVGVEIVAIWGFWIILRKPASEGEFELYTDVESRIEHYTKVRTMFKVVLATELVCFLFELFAAVNGVSVGYVFTIILILIIIIFFNEINRIDNILDSLKERKTGIEVERRRRNVSLFLPTGLLVVSVALLAGDGLPHHISQAVKSVGIMLECIGIFITARRRK